MIIYTIEICVIIKILLQQNLSRPIIKIKDTIQYQEDKGISDQKIIKICRIRKSSTKQLVMNQNNNINELKITYEDSLNKQIYLVIYNLKSDHSKQAMEEQVPSKDSIIKEISFHFKQKIYILNEKKEQSYMYQDIHNRIDTCFDFIKTKLTNNLLKVVYDNEDCQFDLLDKFLNWMMECDLSYLTEFIFKTSINLQNQQFQQFNKLITEKLRNLTTLKTHFKFFGELEVSKRSIKQNSLISLDCNDLSSKQQLYCLRSFTKLQQLKIQLFGNQVLNIDLILQEIIIIKQTLTCFKLYFDNWVKINKNSLKIVEKLTQLKELQLSCVYNLSKDCLDLNKLKKLINFQIWCPEPFEYLNSIGNNDSIEELHLNNIKNKNNVKINLGKFENLSILQILFACSNKRHLQQLRDELTEVKKIAPQLKELKLDFSDCIYFSDQTMDDQIISILGQIFLSCTNKTSIHLVTKYCKFTQINRLDLSLQFQLIPNIDLFQLNQYQMVKEINKCVQQNLISFIDYDNQALYFYGILSRYSQYFDKIIEISLKSIYQQPFVENQDEIKKYSSLFTNFKKFFVIYEDNIDWHQENDEKILQQLNILPKNLTYLKIYNPINQNSILSLIENYKKLQILKCKLLDKQSNLFDPESFNKKLKRKVQLNLKVNYKYQHQFAQLLNLFQIQGHFVKITNCIFSDYNIKVFQDIFYQINQSQQRILVKFIEPFPDNQPYSTINNYSTSIIIERLKIIAYEQSIKSILNINPRMVYCDLHID